MTTGDKKIHAKTFCFKKIEESLIKSSDRSEKILPFVVKGLQFLGMFGRRKNSPVSSKSHSGESTTPPWSSGGVKK